MPETVITIVASQGSARTLGSNSQMTGSTATPRRAVNTISTVVSLWRKYLSTRNLSMWVDTAHKSGPEKAKSNHMNPSGPSGLHSALRSHLRACKRCNLAHLAASLNRSFYALAHIIGSRVRSCLYVQRFQASPTSVHGTTDSPSLRSRAWMTICRSPPLLLLGQRLALGRHKGCDANGGHRAPVDAFMNMAGLDHESLAG